MPPETSHDDVSAKSQTEPPATQILQVYGADSFRVRHGVNEGDALSDASELVLEDAYGVVPNATARPLALRADPDNGHFRVAQTSETGQPGAPVFLDCLVTFMGPHGRTKEALILVETDLHAQEIEAVHVYPLTPFDPEQLYALVTIDREGARARLAETACVSFVAGTHITLADGQQVPIEKLKEGDKLLTRDSGPQTIRWIGQQTVRAAGAFAPIVIQAGALNNDRDLTLSPGHRLFIYQRVDALETGKKEVLVKAGLLVNGTTVTQSEGGFVDYHQLLFDKHEIIYAEGIAAESLFVDQINKNVLPADAPYHQNRAPAHEVSPSDVGGKDAVSLLKGASKR
ncbi:Hint domain-containing protein [Aliiroseovarius marinus]|uniref:Hint domain-containing protein n=1 Tax=Aliiroseovarius marinus TaxID=2500159 RepID=UPI003D7E9F04